MECYALYRLPYADSYTCISSEKTPILLDNYNDIGCQNGFVIAPFACADSQKIAIIPADNVSVYQIPETKCRLNGNSIPTSSLPEEQYAETFQKFHNAITQGIFNKLVLARKKHIRINNAQNINRQYLKEMFICACQAFPRLMIMLFSTPHTGTWLIASPEILIEGVNCRYHTIALAGTMPHCEEYPEWSEKNKNEQKIVEEYIENILNEIGANIVKDGPTTMRAGNLMHLRTDFRFSLQHKTTTDIDRNVLSTNCLGELINRMHPTPAVCGMPKDLARKFILENEKTERKYYSGFAGPININAETHLYVSLRCTEITDNEFILYAGGGIMPDSDCQNEWKETEEKMKTIAHVLR